MSGPCGCYENNIHRTASDRRPSLSSLEILLDFNEQVKTAWSSNPENQPTLTLSITHEYINTSFMFLLCCLWAKKKVQNPQLD